MRNSVIMIQLEGADPGTLRRYEETKSMASKPFVLWQLDFAKVFREKGGFDVVIGNPPYIQLQKAISEDGKIKLGDLYQHQGFETFAKTGDIYCLFYEKGYDLLRENGVLAFITSNKWMRAGYGKSLRSFFANNTNPIRLIDFAGQKVFESATVDVNILLFRKEKNAEKTLACIATDECHDNLSVFVSHNGIVSSYKSDESWNVLSPIEQSIKKKIETVGIPLRDWNISINYGIKTGFNDAFIISGEKKDELIAADPKSAEIIRPILRGRDIKRYSYNFADLWLIATFPSRKYCIDDYPAIKEHLLSFGMERLEQTGKKYKVGNEIISARKKTNNKWFETQDSISYWDDFDKQKICWIELTDESKFSFSDDGIYLINTVFFMVGENIKYLLGVLNSKIVHWYFLTCTGTTSGVGTNRWLKYTIETIPVPKLPEIQLTYIEKFVDSVLNEKRIGNSTSLIEDEIDKLVIEAYGLTDKECDYILSQS